MSRFALRLISIFGFVFLLAWDWELWKAFPFVKEKTETKTRKVEKLMPFFNTLQVIEEQLLTSYPEDVKYAAVQRARKQNIAADCSKRNRKDIYPARSASGIPASSFAHILVSDRHQLLYCAVPKVGCINWKRVLMVLEGYFNDTESIPLATAHYSTVGYLKPLSDYSPQEISFRLTAYYKFLFVRHPFERLASVFQSKFFDSKDEMLKKVQGSPMRKYLKEENRTGLPYWRGEEVTFEEFAKSIADSPVDNPGFFTDDWERIDQLCRPCLITYDFIGKFETLQGDANFLLRSLDVSDKAKFPVTRSDTNATSTKQLVTSHFSSLSEETIEKLYEHYQHDFKMFNYHLPEIPVQRNK